MITGLIAAMANSVELLLERYILDKKQVSWKKNLNIGFITISLFMLIGSPFFFKYNPLYLSKTNIIYLAVVIFLSVVCNSLLFFGLKHTKVNEAEPLILTSWIFTIISAAIIYPDERNTIGIALAIIASGSVLLSHLKKHHLQLDRYAFCILLSAFLISIHDLFAKKLLTVYDPYSFYFIRCVLCSVIFLFMYRIFVREKSRISKATLMLILFANVAVIARYVFMYWSYKINGLVYTSLLMCLAPVIILVGSFVFLKEEIKPKNIAASVIIVACVVISIVL